MSSVANLLDALDRANGTCRNIVIFGRVRCAIKKDSIGGSVELSKGIFAILDAYAFKCLGTDYFSSNGSRDVKRTYFTKGSILIYIDSLDWVGQDVKVYGKSVGLGVNIKKQYSKKSNHDGVSAFVFDCVDSRSKIFRLLPSKLVKLGVVDKDTKGTVLEDFMVNISKDKTIDSSYPVDVQAILESIIPYTGEEDYEVLESSEAEGVLEERGKNEPVFVQEGLNEKIDVSQIKLDLVYHLDGAEESESYEDFRNEIQILSSARFSYSKELIKEVQAIYYHGTAIKSDPSELYAGIAKEIRTRFIERIAKFGSSYVGNSRVKGNTYVAELIELCSETSVISSSMDGVNENELRQSIEKLNTMVYGDPDVLYGDEEIGYIPLISNYMEFAYGVISVTTGISYDTLRNNLRFFEKQGISYELWSFALFRIPYLLGMLGCGLDLADCDLIYFTYTKELGRIDEDEQAEALNMNLRNKLEFLEGLKTASDVSSFITKGELRSVRAYNGRPEKYLTDNGLPVRKELAELLAELLNRDVIMNVRQRQKILDAKIEYSDEAIEEMENLGLVDRVESKGIYYLILASDLEKEFLIYDTLINKGKQPTYISDSTIDGIVEEFEESRGFKLEKLQRDAIHLCQYKAAVLSGCAGSGKTTTSDCMTEVLKTLEGYKIIYCTPTGKACRRLAEVIKAPVKTLHSQFGIGIGGDSYMSSVSRSPWTNDSRKIYICDEMAMVSTPLLYHVCRNLGENDLIYFLGDIKQLPPIGKGAPFKNLMKLLPCVELGVSKRAAEGSQVNYNTTLVNCMSDTVVQELYYDNKTFIRQECSDANIARTVRGVWENLMNGSLCGTKLEEDDIQVISPYNSDKYNFAVPKLNPVLQALLRQNDDLLFMFNNKSFYRNDRIIHINRNDYSMRRYYWDGGRSYEFHEVPTFGMVNGEMGKLIGIVSTDHIKFTGFNPEGIEPGEGIYENLDGDTVAQLLERYEEKKDSLRKDSSIRDESYCFIIAKVYDVDLQKDVYVLYRGKKYVNSGDVVVRGGDFINVDLAYALTTHKMQGSQSKAVVLPFGSTCNPRFVNRNMINTMITRSQGIVVMVGTITGMDSPVNQGRRISSVVETKDLLTLLTNGVV